MPKIDAKFDKKVQKSGKIEKNPEKLKILKIKSSRPITIFLALRPKKVLKTTDISTFHLRGGASLL